jgi:hypothetical protein
MGNLLMPLRRWPGGPLVEVPEATPLGLLDGLPEPAEPNSSGGYGLQLLMSPEQISTIDWSSPETEDGQEHQSAGLTIGQADAGNSVDGGSNGSPTSGYVPGWDHVSLAPQDLNPSGLDIPAPAPQSPADPSKPGDKYERGSGAAEYLGTGIGWWNDQNRILGMHFGQEAPDLLEKYTGPVGKALVPIANGLGAAGEIANGAPPLPTLAGAGIKSGVELGAPALGSLIGGALLTPVGLTPVGVVGGGLLGDYLAGRAFHGESNQQVGEAAGRGLDNAGRSYQK